MSNKHDSIIILIADEDICRTYAMGVNSFITKPVSFNGLLNAMNGRDQYCFEIVRLPVQCEK